MTRRGYFIPYRYAAQTPRNLGTSEPLEALFRESEKMFTDLLSVIGQSESAYQTFGSGTGDAPKPEPRWNQDWFTGLDAAVLWAIIGQYRPSRIVEVGSGHSTRFSARAVFDHKLECEMTCIDPAPRAVIEGLPVTFFRSIMQDCVRSDSSVIPDLQAGDILFIDSSHIAMPGTDVDALCSLVLPTIKPGVLVHIHDILLPDPYPDAWDWREYNEHQMVAALLAGGGFQPVFSSAYARTRLADKVPRGMLRSLGCPDEAYETSLWLIRV